MTKTVCVCNIKIGEAANPKKKTRRNITENWIRPHIHTKKM